MAHKILTGDALTCLKNLRDQTIHTCVTSPPYFGLRDYGSQNQVGLESSPAAYVEKLVEIFREVRRVLRDDGTLWLNLGDSYAGSGRGGNPDAGTKQGTNKGSQTVGVLYGREHESKISERERLRAQFDSLKNSGIKSKDLIGIPWRVAFALQQDGWYLRQDIIWHKPNPMPESVKDRCTKAHEYIFLLSKSPAYYFDSEAMQEPVAESQRGRVRSNDPVGGKSWKERGQHSNGGGYTVGRASGNKSRKYVTEYEGSETEEHRTKAGLMKIAGTAYETRNRRSVWTVPTKPFKEAHFATFPPDLIRPCVLAGSPVGGVVLDPFSGAATTGVVALEHGRHFIGFELNPEYVDMAEKRLRGTMPLPARYPSIPERKTR